MALRSHAELNEIKTGDTISPKGALHFSDVGLRGGVIVGLVRRHTMYLTSREGYFAQECLMCSAKVALGVIWWDTALITPEDFYQGPIDLAAIRFASKKTVEFFWGSTTC